MNRPELAHRIHTVVDTNPMLLDNRVNEHLEQLSRIGSQVLDVKLAAVQAGTLQTFIVTIHYIAAV